MDEMCMYQKRLKWSNPERNIGHLLFKLLSAVGGLDPCPQLPEVSEALPLDPTGAITLKT